MSRTHWFPVQLSFLNLMVLFVLPLMSAIICTNQPIFKQYGIKSQLAVARYLNVAVFKLAFLQLELDPDFWYLTLFHTNNNISKAKYSTGKAFAALKPPRMFLEDRIISLLPEKHCNSRFYINIRSIEKPVVFILRCTNKAEKKYAQLLLLLLLYQFISPKHVRLRVWVEFST